MCVKVPKGSDEARRKGCGGRTVGKEGYYEASGLI